MELVYKMSSPQLFAGTIDFVGTSRHRKFAEAARNLEVSGLASSAPIRLNSGSRENAQSKKSLSGHLATFIRMAYNGHMKSH